MERTRHTRVLSLASHLAQPSPPAILPPDSPEQRPLRHTQPRHVSLDRTGWVPPCALPTREKTLLNTTSPAAVLTQLLVPSSSAKHADVRLESTARQPRVRLSVFPSKKVFVEGSSVAGKIDVDFLRETGWEWANLKIRLVAFEHLGSAQRRTFLVISESVSIPASFRAAGDSMRFQPKLGILSCPFSLHIPVKSGAKGPHDNIRYILLASLDIHTLPTLNTSAFTPAKTTAHFYTDTVVYPLLHPSIILSPAEVAISDVCRKPSGAQVWIALHRSNWVAGTDLCVCVGVDQPDKTVKQLTVQIMCTTTTLRNNTVSGILASITGGISASSHDRRAAKVVSTEIASLTVHASSSSTNNAITRPSSVFAAIPKKASKKSEFPLSLTIPRDALSINCGPASEVSQTDLSPPLVQVSYSVVFSCVVGSVEVPINIVNFKSIDPPPGGIIRPGSRLVNHFEPNQAQERLPVQITKQNVSGHKKSLPSIDFVNALLANPDAASEDAHRAQRIHKQIESQLTLSQQDSMFPELSQMGVRPNTRHVQQPLQNDQYALGLRSRAIAGLPAHGVVDTLMLQQKNHVPPVDNILQFPSPKQVNPYLNENSHEEDDEVSNNAMIIAQLRSRQRSMLNIADEAGAIDGNVEAPLRLSLSDNPVSNNMREESHLINNNDSVSLRPRSVGSMRDLPELSQNRSVGLMKSQNTAKNYSSSLSIDSSLKSPVSRINSPLSRQSPKHPNLQHLVTQSSIISHEGSNRPQLQSSASENCIPSYFPINSSSSTKREVSSEQSFPITSNQSLKSIDRIRIAPIETKNQGNVNNTPQSATIHAFSSPVLSTKSPTSWSRKPQQDENQTPLIKQVDENNIQIMSESTTPAMPYLNKRLSIAYPLNSSKSSARSSMSSVISDWEIDEAAIARTSPIKPGVSVRATVVTTSVKAKVAALEAYGGAETSSTGLESSIPVQTMGSVIAQNARISLATVRNPAVDALYRNNSVMSKASITSDISLGRQDSIGSVSSFKAPLFANLAVS